VSDPLELNASNMRTGVGTLIQPYDQTNAEVVFTAGDNYIFTSGSMVAGKSTPPHQLQLRFKAQPYSAPWSSYTD
jgi:hypothetical protein